MRHTNGTQSGSGRPPRAPAQVLALFALGLVALLGVTALGVDGSVWYWQLGRMQNAADAAAAAGLYEMAEHWNGTDFCRTRPCATVATVQARANELAQRNGAAVPATLTFLDGNKAPLSPQPSSSLPSNARGLRVQVAQPYQTALAGVVGVPQLTATAVAQGLFGAPSGMNVFPMVVGSDAAPLPDTASFLLQPPDSTGGCNLTCVNMEMLQSPLPVYPTPLPPLSVSVGSSYTTIGPPAEDGATVSPSVIDYVRALIAADTTGSTCQNPIMPSPRIVFVPYVSPNFNGPPENVTVLGFRAFMFRAANVNQLIGCWVKVNAPAATLNTNGPYTGVTTFKLQP